MTQFRPADNNPLKFSANVDDALHNLLVKRNAAYLGRSRRSTTRSTTCAITRWPMLAGMRVAFEAMLAEFDPDRCRRSSIASSASSALPRVPAKLRYWDLYRERRQDMAKDPEASVRAPVRRGVRAGVRRAAPTAQGGAPRAHPNRSDS